MCVIDCSNPYDVFVNNYVHQVSQTFVYRGIDNLLDEIIINDYISIVDIKDAYHAVAIHPSDRYYSGFGIWGGNICRQPHLYGPLQYVYFYIIEVI